MTSDDNMSLADRQLINLERFAGWFRNTGVGACSAHSLHLLFLICDTVAASSLFTTYTTSPLHSPHATDSNSPTHFQFWALASMIAISSDCSESHNDYSLMSILKEVLWVLKLKVDAQY